MNDHTAPAFAPFGTYSTTFDGSTTEGWAGENSSTVALENESLKISVTAGSGDMGATKTISGLTVNTQYKIKLDMDAGTVTDNMYCQLLDGNTQVDLQPLAGGMNEFSFIAPATSVTIKLMVETPTAAGHFFLNSFDVFEGSGREANLLSIADYYPFGSLIPQRRYNPTEYRYGFNGMEKDDELRGVGNSYGFNFRVYDSRIGKFLSIDPLSGSYASQSPYHFAGNTPIQAIDLEGLELFLVNGYDGYSSATKDAAKSADLAKMVKYWTNSNPDFIRQATEAFKEPDVRHLDGSQGGFSHGNVSERFEAGKDNALKLVNADQVDFSKPITIIAHSQGGAYAAGLASGMLEANPDAVINVLLLAPDGAENFSIDPRVNSVQFTFPDDGVVTDSKASVGNVDQNISPKQEFSPFQSMSISKALKAHSAPIDDKGTAGNIINNETTQETFKTGAEK